MSLIDTWLGRHAPADETLWHKWATIVPVRLVDGGWSIGLGVLWRRSRDGRYEYKQDAPTPEETSDNML